MVGTTHATKMKALTQTKGVNALAMTQLDTYTEASADRKSSYAERCVPRKAQTNKALISFAAPVALSAGLGLCCRARGRRTMSGTCGRRRSRRRVATARANGELLRAHVRENESGVTDQRFA